MTRQTATIQSVHAPVHIVQEPLPGAGNYAAVAIDVEQVDDHRQAAFLSQSGIHRHRFDEDEQRALGQRVEALRELVASGV